VIQSDQGDQIRDLEDQTNKGLKRQRAEGGAARAALPRLWLRFCGRTGAAAPVPWARGCPPGPLSPGAYIYPLGVLQEDIQSLEHCC